MIGGISYTVYQVILETTLFYSPLHVAARLLAKSYS
jgi:hypothetical protein